MFFIMEAITTLTILYFFYKFLSSYNNTLAIVVMIGLVFLYLPITLKIAIILFGVLYYLVNLANNNKRIKDY